MTTEAEWREQLAQQIARTFPGWNEDTEDGPLTAHWEKVNQTCLEMGREHADAALPILKAAQAEARAAAQMALAELTTDAAQLVLPPAPGEEATATKVFPADFIEAVATAIHDDEIYPGAWENWDCWQDNTETVHERYRDRARAALNAIPRVTLREELRVHYSYGVNSGKAVGSTVESIVEHVSRTTYGPVNVDMVERRRVLHAESPWVYKHYEKPASDPNAPRWGVEEQKDLPNGRRAAWPFVVRKGERLNRTNEGTGRIIRYSNSNEAQRVADQLNTLDES